MADYLHKPIAGTAERDKYDAERRRNRSRRCACGNRLFALDIICTPCRRPVPNINLTPAQSEAAERDYAKPSERKLRQ